MPTLKELSKNVFEAGTNTSLEFINAGSIQRIADATEKMAANYIALENDRNYYKRQYEVRKAECERMARRIFALRGVITKQKKKLAAK